MTTSTTSITRRRALSSVGGLGLTLPLLSACGGGQAGQDGVAADGAPTSADTPAGESAGGATAPLTAIADVPVGGGIILANAKLVVTQPTAGEFKCFTAVCTHQSCLVSTVTTTINCSCHGSAFDISTGEVVGGPAPAPLAETAITTEGDQVVLS